MHNLAKIAAVLLASTVAALGASLNHKPRPEPVTFQVVAIADPLPVSSFSPNRDVLLVRLQREKSSIAVPAKVVFRYLGYESRFPSDLAEYNLVHHFTVVRDPSCDEAWQSMSTKVVFGPHEQVTVTESVRYTTADGAHGVSVDTVLPCYVTKAGAYKGSQRVNTDALHSAY